MKRKKTQKVRPRDTCPNCHSKEYTDEKNEWGCLSRICKQCKLEYMLHGGNPDGVDNEGGKKNVR